MNLEKIERTNINDVLNTQYCLLAHIDEHGRRETLQAHTMLCEKYFQYLLKEKRLTPVFQKIAAQFLDNSHPEEQLLFWEMLIHIPTFHDAGKVNVIFQKQKMENNLGIKVGNIKESKHSFLSALIYIDFFYRKLRERSIVNEALFDFLLLNSYVIACHHSGLSDYRAFLGKFRETYKGEKGQVFIWLEKYACLYQHTLNHQIEWSKEQMKEVLECATAAEDVCTKEQGIGRYIYQRLLLSLVFASDFYATQEFMGGLQIKNFGNLENIDEFCAAYAKGEIINSIREFEKGKSIEDEMNRLRSQLFLEAETNFRKEPDANIYYLEAPTGSGKSNVAMNLSFLMNQADKEKRKLIYVYPFNTLVEQNFQVLEKLFGGAETLMNKVAVINSLTPIKLEDQYGMGEKEVLQKEAANDQADYQYYAKALLDKQFLNYPMILTTHVSLFNYLFGTGKTHVFPLHQLANSVIVLDEIQSYKNLIWGEIITFLSGYAEIFNIKIIIMSATLPDLNQLSLIEGKTTRLIGNREKYFHSPIFRDRVRPDYSLMNTNNIEKDLYEHVMRSAQEPKKILVEFIKKGTAKRFFQRLVEAAENERLDVQVELMTGEDKILERKRILKEVRESQGSAIILVATQVVEAGVDIDMDLGYKNISLFDCEEQFMGRINRSCRKEGCVAYFFALDEAEKIYKEDCRRHTDVTLKNLEIRALLETKAFADYYALVLGKIRGITNRHNEGNIDNFFETSVKKLQFDKVEEKMRLIADSHCGQVQIFFNVEIEDESGKWIVGEDVWQEYKALLKNTQMEYAEKQVKLSQIRVKAQTFIYEVRAEKNLEWDDLIGELYYVREGHKYFLNGKLDESAFLGTHFL